MAKNTTRTMSRGSVGVSSDEFSVSPIFHCLTLTQCFVDDCAQWGSDFWPMAAKLQKDRIRQV